MSPAAQVLRALTLAVPASAVRWLGRAQFEHPVLAWAIKGVSSPIRHADMPIVRGPGAGLRINADGASAGYVLGTTEPVVQDVLAQSLDGGDVFYDVGAGIGFFTLIAARLVGPEGRVIAFEPNPDTAAVLRRNIQLNALENVTVVESAVSANPGRGVISLAGPISRLVDGREGTEVDLVVIDDVVTELGGAAPSLVKLDIEGAEAEAFEGMRWTLESARPVIVCETHGTLAEVRRVLDEHGYRTDLLDPLAGARTNWNVHVLALPS